MIIQRRVPCLLLIASMFMLSASSLGCNGEPPKLTDRAFNRVTFYSGDDSLGTSIRDSMVKDIGEAETSIDIAVEHLTDPALTKAIVDAKNRGVTVRFVGDVDSAADSGYVSIKEANIPMTLGDGELVYLPEPTVTTLLQQCFDEPSQLNPELVNFIQCTRRQGGNDEPTDGLMTRPGTMNRMTNTFMVIDGLVVYNFAVPNTTGETIWVGWRAHSQDLSIAFTREFQQMFGGVFSTTLDIYNGPVKSTVHGAVYDSRLPSDRPGRRRQLLEGYLTDRGLLTIHFNPQQRLVKEMIDEIYRARGSVYMMTDEVTNNYVIDALRYKAARFDVQLIVNAKAEIPDTLKNSDILIRRAPASVSYVPTVMVMNMSAGIGGKRWPRTLAVMSHSFLAGPPFQVFRPAELNDPSPDDIIRVYPSDIFVDGNMWLIREPTNKSADADDGANVFDQFESFWKAQVSKATEL